MLNVMDEKRNSRHLGKVVTPNLQTVMPNFYVWREGTALSHVQFKYVNEDGTSKCMLYTH